MKTRYGVEYEIEKSEFTFNNGTEKFFFSSKLHLNKFKGKLIGNRMMINRSLQRRFGMKTLLFTLPDVVLYTKIETRGFYVEYSGGIAKCLNDITLTNGTLTKRN